MVRYSETDDESYTADVPGVDKDPAFLIPIACQSDQFALGWGRTANLLNWDGVAAQATLGPELFRVEDGEEFDTNNLNNGKIASGDRLFTATKRADLCQPTAAVNGSLYIWQPRNGVFKASDGLFAPNGMAWNDEEGKFYLADSCSKTVREFDYDQKAGELSES